MKIKQLLTSLHPKISEMAFMSQLTSGKFQREEILRSEVVELYRALDTRQKIQDIYKKKLYLVHRQRFCKRWPDRATIVLSYRFKKFYSTVSTMIASFSLFII